MTGSLLLNGNFRAVKITLACIVLILLAGADVSVADSPRFLNCPDSTVSVNHCYFYRFNYETNLEGTGNSSKIRYAIAETNVDGDIDIDPVTGRMHYYPTMTDVPGPKFISIQACHRSSGRCDTCTVYLFVFNTPPEIYIDPMSYTIEVGDTLRVLPIAADRDFCDVLRYSLKEGPGQIDADNGLYTWVPGEDDVGEHEVLVYVSDGITYEDATIHVKVPGQYEVWIEKRYDVLQGHFIDVDVMLENNSESMGGFNFLVGYNASALAFTEAALNQQLVDCGWEYFTYRYNWNGNCGESCPSGLVRLVGMAETNNGPHHPDRECLDNVDHIATMTFFVSNDRTLECTFLPIRFYWMDCGDNTIAVGPHGDSLALNRHIYDFDGSQIQDYEYGFPGYWGAPDVPCLDGDRVTPVRFVDFINGGIEIQCFSIDARGDINVNGLANEIADWVMFRDYFLQGIHAFGFHVEASKYSSDVNCDDIPLRLEDFMRLAQVIVGNAEPCEGTVVPDTITADFTWHPDSRVVYVGSPYNKLAAVYMVFMGEIIPTLDLEMSYLNLGYAHDSGITRIIVYPDPVTDPPEFNMCRLFSYTGAGELIEIQAADLHDNIVVTDTYSDVNDWDEAFLPSDYSLSQNHPNPFNPSTEIRFSIPRVAEVTLEIFNIIGQKVNTLADKRLPAGEHAVTWDGCDKSGKKVVSGIYLYRLTAGEYTSSKRMILSK